MATYKIDYSFSRGRQGWKETWYQVRTDQFDAAKYVKSAQVVNRVACLGYGVLLESIRIVNLDTGVVSTWIEDESYTGPQANTADVIGVAVILRAQTSTKKRRTFFMRGLPDAWAEFQENGKSVRLTPTAWDAVDKWRKSMLLDQTAIHLKTLGRPNQGGVIGPSACTGLSAHTDGGYTVVECNPVPTTNPGAVVWMDSWDGEDKKLLNRKGKYQVVTTTGDGVVIDLPYLSLDEPETNRGGRLFIRNTVYERVETFTIGALATRQTGRAPYIPSGKSRRSKK